MKTIVAAFLVAGVTSPIAPVAAQTTADPTAPIAAASTDTMPNASAPPPICTDRPSKANVVCTVPTGSIEIEADVSVR